MLHPALGMLVDAGKVSWDDPVIEHLPGFRLSDPYVTRELTVRDLLTHSGGLGNADLLWYGADYPSAEIVRRIGTLPLTHSLRSDFDYQNIMYAVAGDVVEAASGMPWETFLRTRIFAPLGMTSTEPTLATVSVQPNVATPHGEIDDTMRVISNRTVDQVKAAGSVWSSVTDMAKWMRFILDSGRVGGRRLLSDSTYSELLSPHVIADRTIYPTTSLVRPHFFTYGLGWFLHDYGGQAVAMHTGSIDGMSAIIGLIPDRRLAEAREREKSRVAKTRPSLPLSRYAGTYRNPTYGDVIITTNSGALHLEFGAQRQADLTHWHFDTFRARWSDVRLGPSLVVFLPDGAGGVSALRVFGVTFARTEQAR